MHAQFSQRKTKPKKPNMLVLSQGILGKREGTGIQESCFSRPFLGCALGREREDCKLRYLQGHTGDASEGWAVMIHASII